MSYIGDMFDSSKGSGFQAQAVPLQQAVTNAQTDKAYENTQSGLAQQQAFVNALNAQNGIGNQSNVYNQLSNVAQGTGYNPAQAMLSQSTGQNVANQAALMASQRGSGANTGMLARQAAMQGGALQQQAAGQGATMQAQQSLNALGQMGNMAGQQVSQQQSGIGNYNQFAQGQQQNLLNGVAQYNSAAAGQQASMNQANASIAGQNVQAQSALVGGLMKGAGSAAMMMAEGGAVNGPQSRTAQFLNGNTQAFAQGGMATQNMTTGGKVPGQAQVAGDSYANDTVPALLSPKEIVLPRSITMGANAPEAAKQFVINELKKQKGYADGGEVKKNDLSMNMELPASDGPSLETVQMNPNFMNQGQNFAMNEAENPNALWSPQEEQVAPQTERSPFEAPTAKPQGPTNYNLKPAQPSGGVQEKLPTSEEIEAPVRNQVEGIAAEAQAKGDLGKQQAALAQNRQKEIQTQQMEIQQQLQEHENEVKAVMEDYRKGQINPKQYLDNMSSGGKIQTAIGLILGGIGGALTHTENPAMQFLQAQIDRDIKSQQANLDKNDNLLAANFKRFGNLQDATKMTQAMQLGIYATKLDEAAAKAQDPVEKARAMQAASQLKGQIAPKLHEIKVRNVLLGQNNSGAQTQDPAVAARFLAPEHMQKEALKEVGEYQSMQKAQDNLLTAFDKIDKLNTIGNRLAHFGKTPPQVSALRDPLLASLSKETAGKFTDKDAEYLETLFPSMGDSPETISTKKEQMQNLITQKMNFPTLKSIGVNVGAKEYANRNSKVTPGYQTAKR